jgi:hypothetical protein
MLTIPEHYTNCMKQYSKYRKVFDVDRFRIPSTAYIVPIMTARR